MLHLASTPDDIVSLIKSISGIRGTVGGKPGVNLTPPDVVAFASAFGIWVKNKSKSKKVVIGRDGRVSGELFTRLVSASLQSVGVDVVDVGMAATPTVELAVVKEKAGGGIILSASHNEADWNALKLLNGDGEFISEADGKKILRMAEQNGIEFSNYKQLGSYQPSANFLEAHIEAILKLPLVNAEAIAAQKFKLAVDGINSVGGIAIPRLLRALGVEDIIEIHCKPDGLFAHNPEPLPGHLHELSHQVKLMKCDLGIAVDPDADRLALVCEDGNMFGEEYTLVAVADYVLQHKKGSTVSNLSSTKGLKDITEKAGQKYYSSAVGEVHVVAKMKEVKAVIGGEGNGGIIYPALHYNRDALVGVALFLSHLAESGKKASVLRAGYPNYVMAKKKIELPEKAAIDEVLQHIHSRYKKQPVNTDDGIKIDFEGDWVHLRKSNTEPVIRIYAESHSETKANNLASKIIRDINDFARQGK